MTPERITLTGDGPFYTPMILDLLAEERYRALRERAAGRTRSDAGQDG